MSDSILALWSTDQKDATGLTPDEIERRARLLRRRVMRRDAIEYGAGVIVLAGFGWAIAALPVWSIRISCIAIMIGTIAVMINLWRRRIPEPSAAFGGASIAFCRDQLVRQRDMLASVWRWYLGPFMPGVLMFLVAVGWETARHKPLAAAIIGVAIPAIPVLGMFVLVHFLNRIGARRLQAEIIAIDREADVG
ncbi:hypothetical protein P1X14_15525 [Sphingomonas sp. AOB5]|uniref:hypothetical protein n=1 Tax=Sphingomonas sp. AOB5 TaxID=3034017 RepID=UPI0023F91324|nr:hypothetical protein [Sphingomonas sp. AOB5]MDF7776667.1 hypothetical protein [Sphingomonas sp. AOB5]